MPVSTKIDTDNSFVNLVLFQNNGEWKATYYQYYPNDSWQPNSYQMYNGTTNRIDENGNIIATSCQANSISGRSTTICTFSQEPIWLCNAGNEHAPDHPGLQWRK